MKDADESIGQCAKGLVMGVASLTEPMVVVAGAGGAGQGAKGPLVAAVGEPPVAGQASQDDAALAGRLGDGRAARVILSRFRMGEAGSVVAELRQNPGAEHDAKSGKTAVDLGVRVLLKTGSQLRLQAGELDIHSAQDADRRGHALAVGLADQGGWRQLRCTQLDLDRSRFFLDPTLAASPAQNGHELGPRERATNGGRRGGVEHPERDRVRELRPEGGERGRVILAQVVAQLVGEPLPTPDQVWCARASTCSAAANSESPVTWR